jgi:hypothetical protein
MIHGGPDRRRAQRVSVHSRSWLSVPTAWSVQLIDVGMGGLSFSSPNVIEAGRSVFVRANLGGEPFQGQVRVCWSKSRAMGAGRQRYEIGATFFPLEDSSRRTLERFLRFSNTD